MPDYKQIQLRDPILNVFSKSVYRKHIEAGKTFGSSEVLIINDNLPYDPVYMYVTNGDPASKLPVASEDYVGIVFCGYNANTQNYNFYTVTNNDGIYSWTTKSITSDSITYDGKTLTEIIQRVPILDSDMLLSIHNIPTAAIRELLITEGTLPECVDKVVQKTSLPDDIVYTSGATMKGNLVANGGTDYSVPKVRNIIINTSNPSSSIGNDGDIYIKYTV